jgi:uncharacterized protein (TIGR01244 family)
LFLSIALSVLTGCAATVGKRVNGIDNFATVEPGLHRGGQPSSVGFRELARRGIKTVVNLRNDPRPDDQSLVEAAGMVYINIPMNAADVSPAQIDRALQHLQTAPRPIFLHCRRGRDRTGLEIAVYRIAAQGWTRERAIEELYAHGYNWMWFPGIGRYVRTFNASPTGAPVMAATQ